jgi:GNAT superfamily N-acetyltransferase
LDRELEGYSFGPARPEEEDQIASLSAENFARFDRFNVDPRVPREKVPDVYREWARNSMHGYADLVWVARHEDRVAGFGTWGRRAVLAEKTGVRCACYQLGAVAPEHRQRGLFKRITAGALARLHEWGETWGSGATNSLNTPTQRCFQTLGAWIYSPVLTFRKDLS